MLVQKQRGLTMWGVLYILGSIALVIYIIFKLFPPYMKYYKVKSALDSLKSQGIKDMSEHDIHVKLGLRFGVDQVENFDFKNSLIVEEKGNKKTVRVEYEEVTKVVGNLYFLMDFKYIISE
jgi:hypothetical protein